MAVADTAAGYGSARTQGAHSDFTANGSTMGGTSTFRRTHAAHDHGRRRRIAMSGALAASRSSDEPETRILVVDDQDSITDLIGTALRYEGFRVEVADSGRSAVAAITRFRPHLMILDVMLPDFDGFEVQRRVADYGAGVTVRFLF